MKTILAAAMTMFAMTAMGVGCASSGPDESDDITVDATQQEADAILAGFPRRPTGCFQGPFAAVSKRYGLSVGQARIRMSGLICSCGIKGELVCVDDGKGDPAAPTGAQAVAAPAPVAAK